MWWRRGEAAASGAADVERTTTDSLVEDDVGRVELPSDGLPHAAASSLHSLFSPSAAPTASSHSLGFQRPVQRTAPQKANPAAPPADAPSSDAASSVTLYAALVQVFQAVGEAWQPAGQAGVALVGGPLPKPFQIVLYEPTSKRPFSATTIRPDKPLRTPSAQYVALDDEQQNGWSVYFARAEEISCFLQHVTIVRALEAAATAPSEPIRQDVLPGEGHAALAGDTVGVQSSAWHLPASPRATPPGAVASPLGESVSETDAKPVKCTLGDAASCSRAWAGSLEGMRKGGVRYTVEDGVFYQVEVVKMRRAKEKEKGEAAAAEAPSVPPAAAASTTPSEEPPPPEAPPQEAPTAAHDAEAKAALVQRMAKLAGATQPGVPFQMGGQRPAPQPSPPSPSSHPSHPSPAAPVASIAPHMAAHEPPLAFTAVPGGGTEAVLMQQMLAMQQQAMLQQAMRMGALGFGGLGGGAPPAAEGGETVAQLLVMAREAAAAHERIEAAVGASAAKLEALLRHAPPAGTPPPPAAGAEGGSQVTLAEADGAERTGAAGEEELAAAAAAAAAASVAAAEGRAAAAEEAAAVGAARLEEAQVAIARAEAAATAAKSEANAALEEARAASGELKGIREELEQEQAARAELQRQLDEANVSLRDLQQTNERLEAEVSEMQRTVEVEREAAASSNAVMSSMLTKATESLRAEHELAMADALSQARQNTLVTVKELMSEVYFEAEAKLNELQAEEDDEATELIPRQKATRCLRATIKQTTLRMLSPTRGDGPVTETTAEQNEDE